MHAFVTVLLAFCCVFFRTESVRADQPSPLRVGFVNPGHHDQGFWSQVSSVMKVAASQLNMELYEVYGDRHWKLMLQEGKSLIESQSLDYLILVNEHQKADALIRKAAAKKLPTFMLLNDFDLSDPAKEYANWQGSLIPDNRAAGREMAEALLAANPGPARLFTIVGDTVTPASLDRTAGLDDVMAVSPQMEELLRVPGLWSESVAFEKTQLLLKRDVPDIIWGANDDIALGAIRALKAAGLTPGKDVSVVGLNWSPAGLQAVRSGELLLTHGGHFMAGSWMLVLIYDHHQGLNRQPQRHAFNMSAITSENVGAYQACFGNGEWERIDFKRFSQTDNTNASTSEYDFNLQHMLDYASGCR